MTASFPRLRAAAAGLLLLLGAASASAAISGINGGGATNAQILIDDTHSANASAVPGTTYSTTNQSVWGGNPLGMSFANMPMTGDSALVAIRAYGWPNNVAATPYGLNLMGLTATQNATGSGWVDAQVNFRIEYQIDAAGLSTTSLFLPQYVVSGTVQAGGFALAMGQIDFLSAANGLLETIHYGYLNSTPGAFTNQALTGVALNNLAALNLPANDTLTVDGYFKVRVDPASITISTVSAVPEPSAIWLGLIGVAALRGLRGGRRLT